MKEVAAQTESGADKQPTVEWLFGQFITHLLVGIGRHIRGEQLSGFQFVKQFALGDLLSLLTRHTPLEAEAVLDSIERAALRALTPHWVLS